MMHNPIHQCLLEADIPAGSFRLEPYVALDLFAFSAQLTIERQSRKKVAVNDCIHFARNTTCFRHALNRPEQPYSGRFAAHLTRQNHCTLTR